MFVAKMNCTPGSISSFLEAKSEVESGENDGVVEKSPDGRYIRYCEVLGRGACKIVYKGFDQLDGIEVAWNQVRVHEAFQCPEHFQRLCSEVNLLRTLDHNNIMKLCNYWVDADKKTINMITELFTSGNLRQYRRKHRCVDMKAIRSWARQILQGLHFLHSQSPPIIHRDLKCDNIFINGNRGEVKIGDLGLATVMQQPTACGVVGTFEFMAPEMYEDKYTTLVDIYSFGLCLLELITCEYPYSECKNQAHIYKKVISGIKPASLAKVKHPQVKDVVEKCLLPASQRLTAAGLLKHPFFSPESATELLCNPIWALKSEFTPLNFQKADSVPMGIEHASAIEIRRQNGRQEFLLSGVKHDNKSISLTLRISVLSGGARNIHFMFYLDADTASSIASEMVEEFHASNEEVSLIAEMVDSLILQFVPNWKPSFDGFSRLSNQDKKKVDTLKGDQSLFCCPPHRDEDNITGLVTKEHSPPPPAAVGGFSLSEVLNDKKSFGKSSSLRHYGSSRVSHGSYCKKHSGLSSDDAWLGLLFCISE